MAKISVNVTFETITPLWTGDAWGECKEIRPSSLLGSLRFWFAVYWKAVKDGETEPLNSEGVPTEVLSQLENPLQGKTFKNLFKKYFFKEKLAYDKAIDKALEELGLSVPSRIFGCTGWKSRINIKVDKNYGSEILRIDNIDFTFPLDKLGKNSYFWIRKSLFNEEKELKFFKNVEIKLITSKYWWENYLKEFFEYYKDKIVLVGGKKSFGFGFIRIKISDSNQEIIDQNNNWLFLKRIGNINYSNTKDVLGFNFRYFLRLKENTKFRKQNFGTQGQASKVYVSNLLKKDSNSIYLFILDNPFEEKKSIPNKVKIKYFNFLKELTEGKKND
jgi:CRISPR-associated protein Cmr1